MDKPEVPEIGPQDNVVELSVSELSFAIKRMIEEGFSYVRVRGELGRISRPASGHVYLDLKDEKAVLSGIIWRGQAARLKIQPEQGMEVVATGRLTTYPGQSRYQIVIDTLEPAGEGALLAQLEKLKKRLAAEGLFDEDRKKSIPFLPAVVGIVTSPTGAVIRDMLHGFTERFPVRVIVWPVRVQGETCGAEVAAAIMGFNALREGSLVPRPDVLIVGRGGGSLEDLWGFNEEIVARAAAQSEIPLISAVGHESDWSVLDLVADARAPTPTKAAEWAVPSYGDLLQRLGECGLRLHTLQRRALEQRRVALKAATRGLPRLESLLSLPRQRLDNASERLPIALRSNTSRHRAGLERCARMLRPGLLRQKVELCKERILLLGRRAERCFVSETLRQRAALDACQKLLASLSHKSVLARGYALVRDAGDQMIRSAKVISEGDALNIEFADGQVAATAGAGGSSSKTGKRKKNGGSNAPPQGSLF